MQQQQTQQVSNKKVGHSVALSPKAAKSRIKISNIRIVPAMMLGTVIETQY